MSHPAQPPREDGSLGPSRAPWTSSNLTSPPSPPLPSYPLRTPFPSCALVSPFQSSSSSGRPIHSFSFCPPPFPLAFFSLWSPNCISDPKVCGGLLLSLYWTSHIISNSRDSPAYPSPKAGQRDEKCPTGCGMRDLLLGRAGKKACCRRNAVESLRARRSLK